MRNRATSLIISCSLCNLSPKSCNLPLKSCNLRATSLLEKHVFETIFGKNQVQKCPKVKISHSPCNLCNLFARLINWVFKDKYLLSRGQKVAKNTIKQCIAIGCLGCIGCTTKG